MFYGYLYVNLLLFSLLSHACAAYNNDTSMIHRFRSMKVPGGGLFNYNYLFYFIVVVLCIDKLSNVTEKLGCIIVVNGEKCKFDLQQTF